MFRCLVWILSLATFTLRCTSGHVVVPMTNEQLTEKVHKLEDLPEQVRQLNAKMDYILKRLDDAHPQVTSCPSGWFKFQSSCYGVGDDKLSWGAAQAACALFGAKLAEIESAAENTFLKNLARSRSYYDVWLGGTDLFQEGRWIWASSKISIHAGYTDFQALNDHESEDCLHMRRTDNYKWNDNKCHNPRHFFCEMRP